VLLNVPHECASRRSPEFESISCPGFISRLDSFSNCLIQIVKQALAFFAFRKLAALGVIWHSL
jgi:hypothetical protein